MCDIDGSVHYSLENARLKAEQDRKIRAAEANKQLVIELAIDFVIPTLLLDT